MSQEIQRFYSFSEEMEITTSIAHVKSDRFIFRIYLRSKLSFIIFMLIAPYHYGRPIARFLIGRISRERTN